MLKKLQLGAKFLRVLLYARKIAFGVGLLQLKTVIAINAMKQYIGNSRMNNNVNRIIKACIEQITIEYRYSESLLKVKSENRFWVQGQINNIAKILEEREMIITKYINKTPSITGNRMIMDLAVQYADENKIEAKTRIELLQNINMV